MNTTYRDIIFAFKDFLSQHKGVNQVVDAQTWNYQALENIYPTVIIVPSTSSGTNASVLLSFSIFFCDILIADGSNTRDVYSDMLEVVKDFISYFTGSPELDWTINSDFTLTPFEERFDDTVAGWELDCTVEIMFNHSVCNLPIEDYSPSILPPQAHFIYSIVGDTVILYNKSTNYDDLTWDLPGSIEESIFYINSNKMIIKFNPGTWTITLTAKRQGFQDSTYTQIIEIN